MKPYLLVAGWALVILFLSVNDGIQLPEVAISPDKLGHLIAYGFLSWLSVRALHKNIILTTKTAWFSVAAVILYGILLEFIQGAFFPHRFFEVLDMAANAIGAVLGYFAFNYFTNKT